MNALRSQSYLANMRSSVKIPATFSNLPKELLSKVADNLEIDDLLVLGRASPLFTPLVTDERLWTDLVISLPEYHGERPLIQPYPRQKEWDPTGPHWIWCCKQGVEAEEMRRIGLKEKVDRMVIASNERRLGMVRSISCTPRPRANLGIAHLLQLVAPNLQELLLEGPIPHAHPTINSWRPKLQDTLEAVMSMYPTRFDSLTCLEIGYNTLYHPKFLLSLLNNTPTLTQLDVDLVRPRLFEVPEPDPFVIPSTPLKMNTKLRNVRFRFADAEDEEDEEVGEVIVEILMHSLLLEQASIAYDGDSDDGVVARKVLGALKHNPLLRDLHVSMDEITPLEVLRGDEFAGIKRLIIRSHHYTDTVSIF